MHENAITLINLKNYQTKRIPEYRHNEESPLKKGSFLGIAFHPTKKIVYLSGGDEGTVIIYDYENFKKIDSIKLDGVFDNKQFNGSFTSDLTYLQASNDLLILDRGNFRLVRYSLSQRKIIASIETGRQPFGLAISPDQKTVLVANVGMYAYPLVEGTTPENLQSQYIPFHPYGNNTKASIEGTVIDGKKIPGLGDPNAKEAMSVYCINLTTNKVTARLKTGLLLGTLVEDAEVIGGASPNSIVMGKKFGYVTNATNDNIAVIDYKRGKIVRHIPITVDEKLDKYRGLLPFGITISKDEKHLYVALLGFNAVAKIDIEKNKTIGLIPTGWGTTRVQLSNDDKHIYITSCRGLGAGPNGGKDFKIPVQGTYIGDVQLGGFQDVLNPGLATLSEYTKQAIKNTYTVKTQEDNGPLPVLPGSIATPIELLMKFSDK
jgi:DNA-binding beta-propeller fold protein YncE